MRLNGLVLDLILEAISNTESQTLAATVELIKQDPRSNFVMKLALGSSPHSYVFRHLAYWFSVVSSSTNEDLEDNKPAGQRTHRLLMFLAILWQAGTMGTPHPQMVSSFVSSLGKKLAARDPSVRTLGRDILNALTALETVAPGSFSKDKELNCADIWLAFLESDPENPLDACMCFPGKDYFADVLDPAQLRFPTL